MNRLRQFINPYTPSQGNPDRGKKFEYLKGDHAMLRNKNRMVFWNCGIFAVLWVFYLTGCAQMDQLKTNVKSTTEFEAGNNALINDDHAVAATHYRIAAEAGHPKAAYYLGLLSAGGGDIPNNETEALKWMRMSAEQGYAPAQQHLGMWYLTGGITAHNPEEAARWFRKAAEQNDASAMYFLGVMHARGEGVAKDYNTALEWFKSAAAKGFPVPSENLTMDGVAALDRSSKSVQAPPVQASQPAVQSRPVTVKDIQAGLAELGYDPGPADGLMGRKTANAIKAFQMDANLPVDGKISDELMLHIKEKLNK